MSGERSDPVPAARAARMTQNEVFFREVNEQVAALNVLGEDLATFGVVCECGQQSCENVIHVGRSVYEAVRAQSDRFIVASGHVLPEVETVVEQHAGFVVVDKREGIPEEIAKQTDPRA